MKTGFNFFIKRNSDYLRKLAKGFQTENLSYLGKQTINAFIDKKYKNDAEEHEWAYIKINNFFKEFKIPLKILDKAMGKMKSEEQMKKLFEKYFENTENDFSSRGAKNYQTLVRFLSLKEINNILFDGSISNTRFYRKLVRGTVMHRMFMLFNFFRFDKEETALEDTYLFIRSNLKRGSVINPFLTAYIFDKFKGEKLLSLTHSWLSYQLGFYKSNYKEYFCNDLTKIEGRGKALDYIVKNEVNEEVNEKTKDKKVNYSNFDFTSKELLEEYRDKGIDTVIVCPPYSGLEFYTKKEGQSGNKEYEDFIQDMFRMCENAFQIANQRFILIAANTRIYPLLNDIKSKIEEFEEKYGFEIEEIFETNVKHNFNNFEGVMQEGEFALVFKKK